MVKYTGGGLVVKRPGVLSKVQMLNLVLGVGVFSPLPIENPFAAHYCRAFFLNQGLISSIFSKGLPPKV